MSTQLKKCSKCDERGYISLGQYSARSCECGWAIAQMRKGVEGKGLAELVAYGLNRHEQKQRQMSLYE